MIESLKLVIPQFAPPLEPVFRPAVLANRLFQQETAGIGVPLVIGLERTAGELSRIETTVFPEGHPRAGENLMYIERLLKFLLWQRGGGAPHKVPAVIDGEPVYSEEVVWEPRKQTDPEYHYHEIMASLQSAATK